jgi:hypothetical protein
VTSMRSGYPLAALMTLRLTSLDGARRELAAAIADAVAARARVDSAKCALREANLVRRAAERQVPGQSALELDAQSRWLAQLRSGERVLQGEAERRRELAEQSAAQEDRVRDQVLDAERQLRTVERHRDLWERARRCAVEAAEEAEQEELALQSGRQRLR